MAEEAEASVNNKAQPPIPIGIDLGTTWSCVSYIDNDRPKYIVFDQGMEITPSCVSFERDYTNVGKPAFDRRGTAPNATIYQFKRFMGQLAEEIQHKFEFETIQDSARRAQFRVTYEDREEVFYPEQIAAIFLQYLKSTTEEILSREVTDAVITVPANFNDSQRQATQLAAEIAGFKKIHMLNEPTAAALAYGLDWRKSSETDGTKNSSTVLVYDLGGGTFDVSIVRIENEVETVIVTKGRQWLGGEDFDRIVYEWFMVQFDEDYVLSASEKFALMRISTEAKIELSKRESVQKRVELRGGIVKDLDMTQEDFERECGHLFDDTETCVEEALMEARKKEPQLEIDEVIIVGGSSKIPYVQRMLTRLFGAKIRKDVDADKAIAIGAAVMARSLMAPSEHRVHLNDVVPLSLGFSVKGGLFHKIVPAYSSLPVTKANVYQNVDDEQTSIFIKVYQGESEIASENKLLTTIRVEFPKARRRTIRIKETLDVDANGRLLVTAERLDNNQEYTVTVDSIKLPQDVVDRIRLKHTRRQERDKVEARRRKTMSSLSSAISQVEMRARRLPVGTEKRDMAVVINDAKEWKRNHEHAPESDILARIDILRPYNPRWRE